MINPLKATTYKSLPANTKSKIAALIDKFESAENKFDKDVKKKEKQLEEFKKNGEKKLEKLYKNMSSQELNIVKKSIPKNIYDNYVQWFQKNIY